jgi:DNA-binding transcriptional LysR family regulator
MDLDALQIFKAVVECGGVSKAAAHLNRVPSNITTRVKNLEESLGVQLFQRQGGRLILSSEGELLLGYAQRLLQLSGEAQSALRSGTPRGVLRLGAMESTAAARLPSLLSRYHHRFPQVQIELVTGTSGALLTKVRRFEIEAAFVADPPACAELQGQEAFAEELVLISPRDMPPIKVPADVRQRTLIAFSAGCTYRGILQSWLGVASGETPQRVLELGSYHAIVACVAAGAGIAIMPRSVLEVVHAHSEVAVSALPVPLARSKTCLVWRAGHASVALDALRGELKPPAMQAAEPGSEKPLQPAPLAA